MSEIPAEAGRTHRGWALTAAFAVMAVAAGVGHAGNPDLSGYTQPAPHPGQEKHAADVANRVLRREGSHQTVSTTTLRAGVVLPSRPETRKKPTTLPNPATGTGPRKPVTTRRLAGAGLDPTRRAGVSLPVDQRVGTATLWLIVAMALAAGAAAVELARRRA
jgi:hypothetical protein